VIDVAVTAREGDAQKDHARDEMYCDQGEVNSKHQISQLGGERTGRLRLLPAPDAFGHLWTGLRALPIRMGRETMAKCDHRTAMSRRLTVPRS
jgi:hypothetical protein